jgi:hypothetical protein
MPPRPPSGPRAHPLGSTTRSGRRASSRRRLWGEHPPHERARPDACRLPSVDECGPSACGLSPELPSAVRRPTERRAPSDCTGLPTDQPSASLAPFGRTSAGSSTGARRRRPTADRSSGSTGRPVCVSRSATGRADRRGSPFADWSVAVAWPGRPGRPSPGRGGPFALRLPSPRAVADRGGRRLRADGRSRTEVGEERGCRVRRSRRWSVGKMEKPRRLRG